MLDFKPNNEFICIKDMSDDFEDLIFIRGHVYICWKDDTIRDEKGYDRIYLSYFDKYFEPYSGQHIVECEEPVSLWIARNRIRPNEKYGDIAVYHEKPEWDDNDGIFDPSGYAHLCELHPYEYRNVKPREFIELRQIINTKVDKKFKPMREMQVGDEVYHINSNYGVNRLTITAFEDNKEIVRFNDDSYAVTWSKKSYVRTSGHNEVVCTTVEEVILRLQRQINSINKEIKRWSNNENSDKIAK